MSSGIGFWELLLLFVIGLLILGPERLPRVAAQIGRWVGRARRTANQLRYQLEREIALADIEKDSRGRDKKANRGGNSPKSRADGKEDTTGSPEPAGTDESIAGSDTPADESAPKEDSKSE